METTPRRRRRLPWLVAVVLLIVIGWGIFNFTRPLPQATAKTTLQVSPATASTLQWPANAEAAVGAVGYGSLATSDDQTPKPTASVAKLITALTVLQKYPLQPGQQGPTITLTGTDVDFYDQYAAEDGSNVRVVAGEQLTEYQMLQAMMLPSANNIADSLAIWAYGSLGNYATTANQFVSTLGMTQTHIGSDASGFSPDTTSTASDLLTLGLKVMQNPVLAQIVDQPSAVLPVVGTVYNVNALLGTDGIVGIKTGNSDQAGGVYLFAAQDNLDSTHNVTIVGAVVGAADLQSALAAGHTLLDSVKANFTLVTLASAGQTVGSYTTAWGAKVPVVAKSTLQAVVWSGLMPSVELKVHGVIPPQAAQTPVGTLNVQDSSSSVPVVLAKPLPKPSIFWRMFRF